MKSSINVDNGFSDDYDYDDDAIVSSQNANDDVNPLSPLANEM